MTLKELIDQIYRAANGALQRSEILKLIDQAQARLYSPNCAELKSRTTITTATITTYPTARTITWSSDPRGGMVAGASHVPGDIVIGSDASTQPASWLVDSPFAFADPLTAAAAREATERYCTMIPYDWAATYDPSAVPHEGVTAEDGTAITAGQFVWFPDIEAWWICKTGYTVASATLQADRWTYCAQLSVQPIVDGSTEQVSAMPTYVEVPNFRAVTKVGTLDALTAEFDTTYDVRIVQARTRGEPTLVYTDGLTTGTTYDVEGYLWPASVTSETDDLFVPDSDRDGILKTMVMREIERENFGNSVYWEQLYQKEWPAWLDRLNRDLSRPRKTRNTTFNPLAG